MSTEPNAAVAGDAGPPPRAAGASRATAATCPALRALCAVARLHQIAADPGHLAHHLGLAPGVHAAPDELLLAARHIGLKAQLVHSRADRLPLVPLPALAPLHGTQPDTLRVVVLAQCDGQRVSLQDPSAPNAGQTQIEAVEVFCRTWSGQLLLLASVPIYLVLSLAVPPVLRKRLDATFARGAENQALLVETITGIQTVKASALEPAFGRRWERQLAAYVSASFKTQNLATWAHEAVNLTGKLVNAATLWFGAQEHTVQADALRAQALLQALQQPGPLRSDLVLGTGRVGAIPLGWSNADRLLAQAQLHAEWQDIHARLGRLSAELARRQAEAATARQVVAKTEATLPMARQREDDFRLLSNQGFVASHAGQDRTRERVEQERDLVTQQARLLETLAALAESSSNRAAYLAETRRSLQEREAQALLRFQQVNQEYTKAAQRETRTVLVAPVAGTVQQLAAHTAGGVVVEAQVLMVIVPRAVPDAPLVAEVNLENKDVGFISAGQQAELKLETFPYTRYGTVAAVVDLVSADAVADDKRGAVFPARLLLQKGHLEMDGRPVRLGPGMNVTAEIKIGQQTVMGYLLSPRLRTRSESLGER